MHPRPRPCLGAQPGIFRGGVRIFFLYIFDFWEGCKIFPIQISISGGFPDTLGPLPGYAPDHIITYNLIYCKNILRRFLKNKIPLDGKFLQLPIILKNSTQPPLKFSVPTKKTKISLENFQYTPLTHCNRCKLQNPQMLSI